VALQILILEPYYSGSHKSWCDGLKSHSSHGITLFTLPGRHWKWRLHGAAITFANQLSNSKKDDFDLILASSLMDVSLFKSLLPKKYSNTPLGVYFHENQMTYPISPKDTDSKQNRDHHYSFINLSSALSADFVLFNSEYNERSFLSGAEELLRAMPDFQELVSLEKVKKKSQVLPIGLRLSEIDAIKKSHPRSPKNLSRFIWNHRWEHDKNPEEFEEILLKLYSEEFQFEVRLLGEQGPACTSSFIKLKRELKELTFVPEVPLSWEAYICELLNGDIELVTSHHDFFGLSVLEAIYCGNYPILPRRLAYPEHFEDYSSFYDSKEEALSLLRARLTRLKEGAEAPFIPQNKIENYRWETLITQYDDAFFRFSQK